MRAKKHKKYYIGRKFWFKKKKKYKNTKIIEDNSG
jgi:hypothetical protein